MKTSRRTSLKRSTYRGATSTNQYVNSNIHQETNATQNFQQKKLKLESNNDRFGMDLEKNYKR